MSLPKTGNSSLRGRHQPCLGFPGMAVRKAVNDRAPPTCLWPAAALRRWRSVLPVPVWTQAPDAHAVSLRVHTRSVTKTEARAGSLLSRRPPANPARGATSRDSPARPHGRGAQEALCEPHRRGADVTLGRGGCLSCRAESRRERPAHRSPRWSMETRF